MPFATSYVNGKYLEGLMAQTINPNWSTDSIAVALHTDSISGQNKNNQESWPGTGTEVSSAGYTTKGQTLTTPTFVASGSKLVFDEADATMVWSGVTFTAQGCIVFNDTTTSPYADPVICAINFGTPQIVSNGTFTITWDNANGIFFATY